MNSTLHRFLVLGASLLAIAPIACEGGGSAYPSGGATDASAQAVTEDADTIPCEPRAVLETVCQTCHSRPTRRGAPFPLVTRSNIVRLAPTGEIRMSMIEQLAARRMPLAPQTITEEQRSVLLAWLRAGAPAVSSRSCVDAGAEDAGKPDAPPVVARSDVDASGEIPDAGVDDASPEDADTNADADAGADADQ